jgi:diguanylate cyclase (GGDEF)-like protein
VLKRVAELLLERCRKTDMVARYGGEEFLVSFPRTDLRHARALCEQLRVAVQSAAWANVGAAVTLSFGVAEYRGESQPETLIARADRQLYAAKNGGRNRVVA